MMDTEELGASPVLARGSVRASAEAVGEVIVAGEGESKESQGVFNLDVRFVQAQPFMP